MVCLLAKSRPVCDSMGSSLVLPNSEQMADNVSKKERSRVMRLVRSTDTTPELFVRKIVHSLGFRFRLHVRELPGTPDLVFPRLRKVINVSGCFWHMHSCGRCRIPTTRREYWIAKLERNARRDQRTNADLRKAGWDVLTVWECQTTPARRNALKRRLLRFLSR